MAIRTVLSTPKPIGMDKDDKPKMIMGKKRLFGNLGAGKLNKSGATTKSESLARLRQKGALA